MGRRIGDVVLADLGKIEIEMRAVLVTERFSSREDGRQVGVAVAVTVGHTAAPEDLRGIEQGRVPFPVFLQLVKEVAELADEEGVGLGETPQLLGIAVVMTESVACLQDADLRDAAGVTFTADAASDDASGIGAQRHDHEIVEQAVVLARLSHAELTLEACGFTRWHGGLGDVEPFIGAAGAFFDLPHGGEIFVQLAAILAAELVVHAFRVIGHNIEDAAAAAEPASNRLLAVPFDAKEHVENLLRVALGGNLNAVL